MTTEGPAASQFGCGAWRHRTAATPDSEEANLRHVDWEQAQAWCNFVVLQPGSLPSALSVENLSLRPEAPPGRTENMTGRPSWHDHNRCSLRFEIRGGDRCLRVKEFLYDWAPPAFDHPSLWKSHAEPFEVGKNIGWLGTDFRKTAAAAVSVDRTTIELSTCQGKFDDEELREICRGLCPVNADARQRILATPVATLCYQSRYREPIIEVPCGYFAHQRRPATLELAIYNGMNVPLDLPGLEVLAWNTYGFRLDTVFVYGTEHAPPQEIDYLCETGNPPGGYVRLLVSPADSGDRHGIAYPPQLDLQPCSTRMLNVCGRTVHYAFLTEQYGPHEAVWQMNSCNFMLLTKPGVDTDSDWFARLLGDLLSHYSDD